MVFLDPSAAKRCFAIIGVTAISAHVINVQPVLRLDWRRGIDAATVKCAVRILSGSTRDERLPLRYGVKHVWRDCVVELTIHCVKIRRVPITLVKDCRKPEIQSLIWENRHCIDLM